VKLLSGWKGEMLFRSPDVSHLYGDVFLLRTASKIPFHIGNLSVKWNFDQAFSDHKLSHLHFSFVSISFFGIGIAIAA